MEMSTSEDGLCDSDPGRLSHVFDNVFQDGYPSTEPSSEDPKANSHNALSENDDFSPVEYARRNRLCTPYNFESPFNALSLPTPPESIAGDLEDPEGLPSVEKLARLNLSAEQKAHEKWDVDRETMKFLASVISLSKEDFESQSDGKGRSGRDLRMSSPVISSDAESDIQKLKCRNSINLNASGMVAFAIDEMKGEGLTWSRDEIELPARQDDLLAKEKLEVTIGVAEYLRDVSNVLDQRDEVLSQAIIDQGLAGMRDLRQPSPITPLLLPRSPEMSPEESSAIVCEFDLTSTPEDLIAIEAAKMEEQIMDLDDISGLDDFLDPEEFAYTENEQSNKLLGTPNESLSVQSQRKRLNEMKAEMPLTPQHMQESPTKKQKTGTLSEDLQTMISPLHFSLSDEQFAGIEQDVDSFVTDTLMPFAESAIEQTKTEGLSEFDTTMRIPLPDLDAVTVIPPWQAIDPGSSTEKMDAAQKKLLLTIKKDLPQEDSHWGGASKIERTLPWSPFPARLGKINLTEDLIDDSLTDYITELSLNNAIDLDSFLWKPRGLRVLEVGDSDDEELEISPWDDIELNREQSSQDAALPSISAKLTGQQPVSTVEERKKSNTGPLSMNELLEKRRLELLARSTGIHQPVGSKELNMIMPSSPKPTQQLNPGPSRFGDLSKGMGISNFLHLHRGVEIIATVAPQASSFQQVVAPQAVILEPDVQPEAAPIPFSGPEILPVDKPVQVVISSTTLLNHSLVRKIQSAIPMMDLVERDSTALFEDARESMKRPSHEIEADITLSPSTGLLMTTLQRARQRPLPGQSGFFGVRDRIALATVRYERLLVLVGDGRQIREGHPTAPAPLDEFDTNTLSDLIAFASTLDTSVEIYYIPGGEAGMVQWVASLISRHVVPGDETKLLQDETLWEQFLRKAGMNSYAAQTVLSMLKAPNFDVDNDNSSTTANGRIGKSHGLAAFVKMTAQERVNGFGLIMGGDRVLQRVSEFIDGDFLTTK